MKKTSMFHLINAEPTTVSSSENSKETVSPSSSVVPSLPSVGPVPDVADFRVEISSVESPSASKAKPVKVTSPIKIPVSAPDSTSLYVSSVADLVATFIGSSEVLPISSTKPLSKLWSGATIVM
jgi:hypothetical protein